MQNSESSSFPILNGEYLLKENSDRDPTAPISHFKLPKIKGAKNEGETKPPPTSDLIKDTKVLRNAYKNAYINNVISEVINKYNIINLTYSL